MTCSSVDRFLRIHGSVIDQTITDANWLYQYFVGWTRRGPRICNNGWRNIFPEKKRIADFWWFLYEDNRRDHRRRILGLHIRDSSTGVASRKVCRNSLFVDHSLTLFRPLLRRFGESQSVWQKTARENVQLRIMLFDVKGRKSVSIKLL